MFTFLLLCMPVYVTFAIDSNSFNILAEEIQRDNALGVEKQLKSQQVKPDSTNADLWTPIHVAARWGSLAVLRYLVGNYPNLQLTAQNVKGEQPLHLAALSGNFDCVSLIIDTALVRTNSSSATEAVSSILDVKQFEGKTPLFYAARSDRPNVDQVIALLVEKGANIAERDYSGKQAIHEAIVARRERVVKILLKSRDQRVVSAKCCGGKFLSHFFAEFNMTNFADSFAFNALALDSIGQVPLCWAASNGSVEFTQRVVSMIADVKLEKIRCSYPDYDKTWIAGSLLHMAVYHRQLRYVTFLIRNLTSYQLLNGQDSTGGTPLHVLCLESPLERNSEETDEIIAETLLGINSFLVESSDYLGRTPFLKCARTANLKVAKLLFNQWHANPSAVDSRGYNAYHQTNSNDFVDFLLENSHITVGLNDYSNQMVSDNVTPLHIAVIEKKPLSFVKHLLDNKVKVDSVNVNGQNIIHLAIGVNNLEVLTYFIANQLFYWENLTEKRDYLGRTPFIYALQIGNIDAVNIFIDSMPSSWMNATDLATYDSPLHLIARYNAIRSMTNILAKGANVTSRNLKGFTFLHETVIRQNVNFVKELYTHSKRERSEATWQLAIFETDRFGRTPVHLAVRANRFDLEMSSFMLASLNANGVDYVLKIRDDFGDTVLHRAVIHQSVNLVKLLLVRYYASCQIKNNANQSAFQLAKALGYDYLAEKMTDTRRCGNPINTIRLTGGVNNTYGFVEIFHDEKWRAICNGGFNKVGAIVACKSLCLSYGNAIYFSSYAATRFDVALGTSKAYSFVRDRIQCSGVEKDLHQCIQPETWGIQDCRHNEKIVVICR